MYRGSVRRRGNVVHPFLVLLTVGAVLLNACGGMRPEIQAPEDEPPPAPPILPPVLSAGASTSSSGTVQWTAPDTELVISGYELRWRRAGDTNWTTVADIATAPTEYTIPDLDAGTTYEIQVRARYAGEEGEWSLMVTVATAPPPPVLAAGEPTSTAVTVTWTVPGTGLDITGYELHWRRAGDTNWTMAADVASTPTEHTIEDLDADTTYEIRVRARYADEEGEWSLIVLVQTTAAPPPSAPAPPPPPRTPPIFRVTMTTRTSATVEWTATAAAITHYDLKWKSFLGDRWLSQIRVPSTPTTYTINFGGACHCIVGARTVTGDVVGNWFYVAVETDSVDWRPRVQIVTDDAVYDEGDGAVEFFLTPQDRLSEALTVSVYVGEDGSMLKREGIYEVQVGVGSTKVKFRVGLEVDSVDEPGSFVYARIDAGVNYAPGDVRTVFVYVNDDD